MSRDKCNIRTTRATGEIYRVNKPSPALLAYNRRTLYSKCIRFWERYVPFFLMAQQPLVDGLGPPRYPGFMIKLRHTTFRTAPLHG